MIFGMKTILLLFLGATLPQTLVASPFSSLAIGNGFGYQIYDSSKNRLTGFLDHPYRYLRPSSEDPKKEGPERRNLLESFSHETEGGPLESGSPQKVEFVEETNILRAQFSGGERYFLSPYGLEENILISLVHFNGKPPANLTTKIDFHLGANPKSPMFWVTTIDVVKIPGEKVRSAKEGDLTYWIETGKGEGSVLYIPLSQDVAGQCNPACEAPSVRLTLTETPKKWSGLAMIYVEEKKSISDSIKNFKKWRLKKTPEEILQTSLLDWSAWRKEPKVQFVNEAERKIWRQSETVLRLSQVLEKNLPGSRRNHGMILASLPPGAWTTAWVRDGSYATVALSRIGHFEEAKKSLNFFLEADPVGQYSSFVNGQNYRISLTRYFGNGAEEADYANQSTPNIETDGWGLSLWAARQYVEHSGDTAWLKSRTTKGQVYDVLKKGIVKPIESQLDAKTFLMKPDSSIWEVHQQNAKHFLYTSMSAARGLCDFAALAKKMNHEEDYKKYSTLSEKIRKSLLTRFRAPENFLLGALERSKESDTDGATLEVFSWGLLESPTNELASKTLRNLENLKTPSGGYKRMASLAEWELNEWFFIGARMANALWLNGRKQDGDQILSMLIDRSAKNHHLIPEMYNSVKEAGPLGEFAGSAPMSGYGAGIYLMTLLDRQGLRENGNCAY